MWRPLFLKTRMPRAASNNTAAPLAVRYSNNTHKSVSEQDAEVVRKQLPKGTESQSSYLGLSVSISGDPAAEPMAGPEVASIITRSCSLLEYSADAYIGPVGADRSCDCSR